MLQSFEWDLLAAMIFFQGKHQVSELNVVRDEFNKTEQRKIRATSFIIWVNIAYHAAKVIVPVATLISCGSSDTSPAECYSKTNSRIHTLLLCDLIY